MTSSLNKYDNLALEASAGTGKTFNLAMRVAGMLLTGVQPGDILCLTFTKKATAEMKERIIKFINSMAENSAEKSEIEFITPLMQQYAEQLNEEFSQDFICTKAKEAQTNLFNHFSELNIKTIDAFNNTILRIFPFEAGFRPDFTMQSDNEIDILKNDAFYQILSQILKDSNWHDVFNKIYKVLNISTNMLIPNLKIFADFSASNTIRLKNAVNNAPNIAQINTMLNNALKLQEQIPILIENFYNSFKGMKLNIQQTKACEKLNTTNKIKDIAKLPIILNELGESTPSFKTFTFSQSQYNIHRQIREALQQYYILYGSIITSISLNLGNILHKKMKEIKKEANILTYTDISEEVYYMLSSEYSLIDKDYLYFRLDGKINHLLIDEFQDTSISQWLTLQPLAEEAMAGLGQNDKSGSFFYVGDPKQNIYRFRGGSSSLFRALLNKYAEKLKYKTLDTNFRSGKNIVDIVNKISNMIYDFKEADFPFFKINQVSHEKNGEGYVEILHSENKNEEGLQYYLLYTLDKINKCIKAGYSYKDITVLTISNNHGSSIIEYLEDNNIPVQAETSAKLTSSPVFKILTALAEFIETGSFFAYMTFILTEPKAVSDKQLTDKSTLIKNSQILKSYISNMTDSSIFEKILFLSNKLDLQTRFDANPDFTSTLDIMEQSVYGEKNIALFKENLLKAAADKQILSAAENNAVTVMTIHKSKGLQFPVVILPNLTADIKLTASASNKLFIADKDKKFGDSVLCYIYSKTEQQYLANTDIYKYMADENTFILQDSINMLYVAMTRAEQALFINCEISKDEPANLSKLLNSLLKENITLGTLIPPAEKNKTAKKSEIINITINNEKTYTTDLAFFNSMEENMITHSYEATLFGTCLHAGLYFLEYGNENTIKNAKKFIITRYTSLISSNDLNRIMQYIENVYNNPLWQQLFQGRVFKERQIGTNNSLYTVDIYSEFNDKIIIMDYKTGIINENIISSYKKQLLKYASILKHIYNKKTECYIFHIEKGIINITE